LSFSHVDNHLFRQTVFACRFMSGNVAPLDTEVESVYFDLSEAASAIVVFLSAALKEILTAGSGAASTFREKK